MKKSKKFIVSVVACALALCSVPAVEASAAPPPSTEPRIYVELTEDDKGIRADIIMENVPDFRNAVIGFNLSNSWQCVTEKEDISVTLPSKEGNALRQVTIPKTNKRYVLLTVSDNQATEQDYNGVVDSFYIKKTESFDLSDSGLTLYHGTFAEWMVIYKADGTSMFDDVYYSSPRMLEADEFMYGDVTGDGYISGSDATWALTAFKQHGEPIKVTDLYNNYKYGIKDMKAAYAADVNNDGYIDETDANIILFTYTELLSGKNFDEIDGIVGDIDVYEVY